MKVPQEAGDRFPAVACDMSRAGARPACWPVSGLAERRRRPSRRLSPPVVWASTL